MRRLSVAVVVILQVGTAAAQGMPERVGTCVETTVAQVSHRLEDGNTHVPIPESGSAITYSNGGGQVSYDEEPAVNQSRKGDPIRLCLVSIPRGCPRGDTRGRVYKATNLRTHGSWTMADAQHQCGGA